MNFNINELKNLEKYENIQISKSFTIKAAAIITKPKNNSIMFVKKVTEQILKGLEYIQDSLILVSVEDTLICKKLMQNNLVLPVERPRREYAILLTYILSKNNSNVKYRNLDNGLVVGENIKIGNNAIIEPGVFIDSNVEIGDSCIIKSGVKIRSNVVIGNNSIIGENCVIGGQGFGIERDEDGTNIRIPHIGGVIIGGNVEIGALSSIASGTIEPTIIEDYVKIDEHVFIAHNCKVGRGSFVIACAELSGSVIIGENCWIGPNVSIINGINIEKNTTVGIGAVVTKNIGANQVVAGNPANTIENIKKINKYLKSVISS